MSIRYQLPNGKYVYLTLDQVLDMDLASMQELMADDAGFNSEDPFDDSTSYEPTVWEVPELEKEEESIPEQEKQQIKKDFEI